MKLYLALILIIFLDKSTAYQHNNKKKHLDASNFNHKNPTRRKFVTHQQQSNDEYLYEQYKSEVENSNVVDLEEFSNNPEVETVDATGSLAHIEIDMLQCPKGCVCQYAQLMDLPISRWISYMQQKYNRLAERNTLADEEDDDDTDDDDDDDDDKNNLINNNESSYEGDTSYLHNPYIKQATCIVQEDSDIKELIINLPHDLQALILLYTGIGRNKSVNISALKPLNQLSTLEVRGPQDGSLRLILDAPVQFLKHANFESVTLIGSEVQKRPNNVKHPKEDFNYKPYIELFNNIDFNEKDDNTKHYDRKLLIELQQQEQEELEIVPYEVYMEEVKKAKMPSFYGWQHLQILRIHSCGLNELSWETFMGLNELKHLSLERNNIQIVSPFSLSGATQLKTLSLAHNAIYDLHYRSLAGLFQLQVLDLSDNRLTKLTELSFPPLPKIERVDFRSNPIRYIFPATFWVMNNTREMYFGSSDTSLELWGNQPFKKLRKLTTLEIANVSINILEQNIFKDLISLQKLKLHGQISSIEFDAFSSLSQLEELVLANCHINEISMDAFIGCRKLRVIDLSANNISYIPTGLFDEQAQLEEIYLNKNQLKALSSTIFQKRRLMVARLNDNPWKCSCDMISWKPKITNQESAANSERCINDYFTGKELSCRKFRSYKFNKQLAPRCENFKGRTVYYVVRKQMQCGSKYIQLKKQVSDNQRIPHWRKLELEHQTVARRQQHIARVNNSTYTQENHILWQIKKQNKVNNTLNYQILNASYESETKKTNMSQWTEDNEDISNDI